MTTQTTEYTLEEVSKHNTTQSCWVIVDDLVYDVTDFINNHPGSKEPFNKYGGKDATAKFKTIAKHNKSHVQTFMKVLCIGKVKKN